MIEFGPSPSASSTGTVNWTPRPAAASSERWRRPDDPAVVAVVGGPDHRVMHAGSTPNSSGPADARSGKRSKRYDEDRCDCSREGERKYQRDRGRPT